MIMRSTCEQIQYVHGTKLMDCDALGRLACYSNSKCCYNEFDETVSVPMNEPDDCEPPK